MDQTSHFQQLLSTAAGQAEPKLTAVMKGVVQALGQQVAA